MSETDAGRAKYEGPAVRALKGREIAREPLAIPAQMADDLRMIRDHLFGVLGGRKNLAAGFASTNHAEGTTTVALKLALVTADKARRVLVVDASATAGLTGMLGLAGRPGLAQLAAGASPSDVVHRTEIDHLAVVAAGEGAGADLTEADWPRIVRQLSGMADVVFFDLPPILTSTLAPKVSAACDGLVLVVAAHRTRREAIRQAKAKLEYAGDVKLLGAILNGREYFIPDFLYRRA